MQPAIIDLACWFRQSLWQPAQQYALAVQSSQQWPICTSTSAVIVNQGNSDSVAWRLESVCDQVQMFSFSEIFQNPRF